MVPPASGSILENPVLLLHKKHTRGYGMSYKLYEITGGSSLELFSEAVFSSFVRHLPGMDNAAFRFFV